MDQLRHPAHGLPSFHRPRTILSSDLQIRRGDVNLRRIFEMIFQNFIISWSQILRAGESCARFLSRKKTVLSLTPWRMQTAHQDTGIDVIMADPPWDIHMDLPYGTMTDDEMREMGVGHVHEHGAVMHQASLESCRNMQKYFLFR